MDETDADADLSTVLVRCAVLPSLVANLPCTLGMVYGPETFCTSCDKVINATLSTDCIDGTQARVCAASAGQYVGHERLLEQRLDMNPPMK